MPVAAVFVSHSSPLGTDRTYLEAFLDTLKADDPAAAVEVKVLADPDLRPGRAWNAEANEWMTECHAAVVLVSPAALRSSWVLKEATMLTWRRCTEDGFPLLAVGVGVEATRLKRGRFGPLQLDTLEWIDGSDPHAAADKVRTEVQQLAGSLDTVRTPLQRLTEHVAGYLAEAAVGGLGQIARKLKVKEPGWTPASQRVDAFADVIARQFVRGERGELDGLRELASMLRNDGRLNREPTSAVVRALEPLWVDAEAAARLPRLAMRRPAGAAGLNGAFVADFTAAMYLSRAFPLSDMYDCIQIEGGHDDTPRVEQLKERLRTAVRARPGRSRLPDAMIDLYIRELTDPTFVLLPRPYPDEKALAALRQCYPNVAFVLDMGDELPAARPKNVERLLPALEPGLELKQFTDVVKARETAARS